MDLIFLFLLLFTCTPSLVQAFETPSSFESRTSSLNYNRQPLEVTPNVKIERKSIASPMRKQTAETSIADTSKKPTIPTLYSLDELQCFLQEEEDRLVAVKFYAPWCKKCQRLGEDFRRFAREWGDGILDRKIVEGRIRCVQVEFKNFKGSRWVMKDLQVKVVPTLQLYSGVLKLWQELGAKGTKELQTELRKLEQLSVEDIRAHGELVDDGILKDVLEDSFYNFHGGDLDFLNEEW